MQTSKIGESSLCKTIGLPPLRFSCHCIIIKVINFTFLKLKPTPDQTEMHLNSNFTINHFQTLLYVSTQCVKSSYSSDLKVVIIRITANESKNFKYQLKNEKRGNEI